MCLVLLAHGDHPAHPLVIAANRDEFHARPTAAAAPWPDDPRVFGGRDLAAGGSWLALRADGRFAVVTNVRRSGSPAGERSRGALVADFVRGDETAAVFVRRAEREGAAYGGFSLLLGDAREVWYVSNRYPPARRLDPGRYALSNAALDEPWPKLVEARAGFERALAGHAVDIGTLFETLRDERVAPEERLPDTGVGREWESRLSAVFIRGEEYGTRCSTVVVQDTDGGIRFEERSFGPVAQPAGSVVQHLGRPHRKD